MDLVLDTPRLRLRPLTAEAARALLEDRVAAARVVGVELAEDWPQRDLFDVLPMLAAATRDDERFGGWLIIDTETSRVVGDLGFLGPPDDAGAIEIGYCVAPSVRRRGYAVEAVSALIAWSRAEPRVRSVHAGCDRDNAPSIRVLERCGFVRDGEKDGVLRWRLG